MREQVPVHDQHRQPHIGRCTTASRSSGIGASRRNALPVHDRERTRSRSRSAAAAASESDGRRLRRGRLARAEQHRSPSGATTTFITTVQRRICQRRAAMPAAAGAITQPAVSRQHDVGPSTTQRSVDDQQPAPATRPAVLDVMRDRRSTRSPTLVAARMNRRRQHLRNLEQAQLREQRLDDRDRDGDDRDPADRTTIQVLPGKTHCGQHEETQLPDVRRDLQQRELPAAVLEQQPFVDHRELVVRLLVVQRNARRLGNGDEARTRRTPARSPGRTVPQERAASASPVPERRARRAARARARVPTSAPNVTSRLAAIPANALRVSSAASSSTKRPERQQERQSRRCRRCARCRRARQRQRGSEGQRDAERDAGRARATIGDTPSGSSASLAHSFARSRYGWITARPRPALQARAQPLHRALQQRREERRCTSTCTATTSAHDRHDDDQRHDRVGQIEPQAARSARRAYGRVGAARSRTEAARSFVDEVAAFACGRRCAAETNAKRRLRSLRRRSGKARTRKSCAAAWKTRWPCTAAAA